MPRDLLVELSEAIEGGRTIVHDGHTYLYVIVADDEGDDTDRYFVYFPNLPGCMTQADTIEQAREYAAEALDLWLNG